MEFKGNYSSLVNTYLKKYKTFRIKLNTRGQVLGVEINKNGTWLLEMQSTEKFMGHALLPIKVKTPMTMTIKK